MILRGPIAVRALVGPQAVSVVVVRSLCHSVLHDTPQASPVLPRHMHSVPVCQRIPDRIVGQLLSVVLCQQIRKAVVLILVRDRLTWSARIIRPSPSYP